jgi:hypothetical protein
VRILVVMYSINVFLTFTFSQFGVLRHLLRNAVPAPDRGRRLAIMAAGLAVTLVILVVTILLKFEEGGWVTLIITGALVGFCLWVRRHYDETTKALRHLDEILANIPPVEVKQAPRKQPLKPAALLMVNGYNGMGIHSFLAIHRFFPGHFKNFVFLSVGVVDSDRFKGKAEIENLRTSIQSDLDKYVELAKGMGLYAESRMDLETDVIEGLEDLCKKAAEEWPKKVFFTGQLAFEGETYWTRFLHNQTAFAIQRRLLFAGLEAVILPIRVRLRPMRLPG